MFSKNRNIYKGKIVYYSSFIKIKNILNFFFFKFFINFFFWFFFFFKCIIFFLCFFSFPFVGFMFFFFFFQQGFSLRGYKRANEDLIFKNTQKLGLRKRNNFFVFYRRFHTSTVTTLKRSFKTKGYTSKHFMFTVAGAKIAVKGALTAASKGAVQLSKTGSRIGLAAQARAGSMGKRAFNFAHKNSNNLLALAGLSVAVASLGVAIEVPLRNELITTNDALNTTRDNLGVRLIELQKKASSVDSDFYKTCSEATLDIFDSLRERSKDVCDVLNGGITFFDRGRSAAAARECISFSYEQTENLEAELEQLEEAVRLKKQVTEQISLLARLGLIGW